LTSIKFDVFINATPIGMVPKTNFSPILPRLLKPNMLVVDFVYTPPITKLLRDAKKQRCKTISGVDIFKGQAKLQQKIFKSVI
jgi:shikimate 5-dehydrogenase